MFNSDGRFCVLYIIIYQLLFVEVCPENMLVTDFTFVIRTAIEQKIKMMFDASD